MVKIIKRAKVWCEVQMVGDGKETGGTELKTGESEKGLPSHVVIYNACFF